MKTIILIKTLIFSVMIICVGCGINIGSNISEGVITYKLDYSESKNSSSLLTVLPSEMEMRFKDNNTSMQINGLGGAFGLTYVNDYKNKCCYSMLRILFNKYFYKSSSDEVSFGYNKMSDIVISNLPDTMTICGYLCNKAVAHSDKYNCDYELWYTKDIKVKNPNASTPFNSIDGVLLKFDVYLSEIYLTATAVDVVSKKIPDETFIVPGGYTEVDKEEIENIIKSFDRPTGK